MTPAQCAECGREISPESVSCPHCGATQSIAPPPSGPPGGLPLSPFRKPALPPRPQTPGAAPLEELDTEVPPSIFTPMRGLFALGTLLIIGILWYGMTSRSSSEKSKAPPAPAPASSPAAPEVSQPPVATPVVPQLSADERQAANDTLEALKTLQSMAAADIAFKDYMSRVLNAKGQVEKYLQAEGGDPAIKDRVYEAM